MAMVYFTVEQWAERLRNAKGREYNLAGQLAYREEHLYQYCERMGWLHGQYAGVHRLDPVKYFHRYGLSRWGYMAWRKYASGREKTISFEQFGNRHPEALAVKRLPYPHALEIVRLVYDIRHCWTNSGQLLLDHYPCMPDDELPPLYDLITGWALYVTEKWEDGVPIDKVVIRSVPAGEMACLA